MDLHLILPIANGFDEKDPRQPDAFTCETFKHAINKLFEILNKGGSAKLVIGKSVVRGPEGDIWWEVLYEYVQRKGVLAGNIQLIDVETWNATTDGLAVVKMSKSFPDARIIIYVYTGGWVKKYLDATYRAVAKRVCGAKLNFVMEDSGLITDSKSQMIYFALWLATVCTAWNRWTYRLWFNIYNRLVGGRKVKFTRTVSQ